MAASSARLPTDETAAWCERAAIGFETEPAACLTLVREGILLRRRWDIADRDASQRRRLLTHLAAAQIRCHRLLSSSASEDSAFDLKTEVLRQLGEDDAYLADLLGGESLPVETLAFAIECFRDDLHWLGTLVASAAGGQGIDFTGRVLLEQESLQRMMHAWEVQRNNNRGERPDDARLDSLERSAARLRETALARQAEALLSHSEPNNVDGWYETWRAASRLAMRPQGVTHPDLEQRVRELRRRTASQWREGLHGLSPEGRDSALHQAVDDLSDAVGEALIFLEDMPLGEAVAALAVLADDAVICMRAVAESGSADLGQLRRRLRRRRRAIAAELQERRLAFRLENLLGHRPVAAMERLILLLLVLFTVMLLVETPLARYERTQYPGSNRVEAAFAWADLAICLVFLAEFTLKFSLVRQRWLFLRRNWITMLVPSIPFGFILYLVLPTAEGLVSVEAGETVALLRLFRLPRMVRWLRIARPVIRVGRVVAFVMQASDRLVRQLAPLLNRNLVLFERAAFDIGLPPHRADLASLRERFTFRAGELVGELPPAARARLVQGRIDDLTAMLSAPEAAQVPPAAKAGAAKTTREIPLESVISWLLAATPAGVSERIGRNLAQSVSRWCKALDVFFIRRLPIVRDLVAAGRRTSPYGTAAHVANRLGVLLKHGLDRIYWVADLYGTLTAPQLVDSVGEWLVRGTARPARRFLMVGGGLLVVSYLTGLLPMLDAVSASLRETFGTPLIVIGVLCMIPLLLGLWFRQIAGEATDFCGQVAEAHFITATKRLKRRLAEQHHSELERRVLEPEEELHDAAATSGKTEGAPDDNAPEKNAGRALVGMLFEDYLDGAPFHRSDTKTTNQLLGNLTLVALRETRLHYGRGQRKRIRRLDLEAPRSWLWGPYLWFHFISRSLAHQTAKLVVDYNAHAVPLSRAAGVDDATFRDYLDWLARRLERPAEEVPLAPGFQARRERVAEASSDGDNRTAAARGRDFHGSDFTAIHFLSAAPELEADVRRRYGAAVADLMHRDRRDNIRRVFRTYPFHHRPKEERTVNPLAFYEHYLAGGRVLLMPFRLAWWSMVLATRAVLLLARFVRDVLEPTVVDQPPLEESDPFPVAVRKIHRMRKPVFIECLQMRAAFDPEYAGAHMPGLRAPESATRTPVDDDLALVDADPGLVQEFHRLAAERRKQVAEFRRRHLRSLDFESRSAESLRAMTIAYTVDYQSARTYLESTDTLRAAFDAALAEPAMGGGSTRFSLRAAWFRLQHRRRFARLFEQAAFADYNALQRRKLTDEVSRRRGELAECLFALTGIRVPADPVGAARSTLSAVGRDPAPWTRQLVVLRAVQTLSVLDLTTYCDLVAELGEYEDTKATGHPIVAE